MYLLVVFTSSVIIVPFFWESLENLKAFEIDWRFIFLR